MDTYSSGEDVILKKRKPYTITKQREKWTEEEHRRFLEALKLYGRAWQRIEEHIGTKTAVQIRSHAQKFFSKLEREALVKGVPLGQAHGIEIPPPRPKRKPSSPYPRKTSASSTPPCKKNLLDMSIGGSHQKKHARDEIMWGRSKAACDQGKCSLGLSLFQDSPCRTTAVPLVTTPVAAAAGNGGSSDVDLGKFEGLSIDTQIKTPPKRNGAHPVNVVKGETNSASYGAVSGTTADRPVGKSTSSSGTAPFFNLSSSFSSLVVSTLLQNPAAHAAATLAASLWPSADVEASSGSTSGRRFSPVPSMAALAVATVAAASAWWATHGSLPYYPPAGLFRGGFAYAPAPTRAKTSQAATPASKTTPLSSSSDSDENPANQLNPATAESGDGRGKKKADRSSCGSNTPSSSDVETNVAVDAENEEAVHLGLGYLPAWKEVSQEGRLAFQALFSREVLPQSFSPPQDEGGAKPRRTGFKPYKRCSAEAKEGGGAATPAPAEKDSKRIRLDGEVSI